MQSEVQKNYLFLLIIAGTILGLAGIDLVLPAVPTLPEHISGTPEEAQIILAAFTGGTAIGLIIFGELGARYDKKLTMLTAISAYSASSFLCSLSSSITELSYYRAIQGFCAAAPAVCPTFARGGTNSPNSTRRAPLCQNAGIEGARKAHHSRYGVSQHAQGKH